MPTINTVKKYLENGIYHVYNRGVEKRVIFVDEHDYKMFLYLLKFYLSKPESEKRLNLPEGSTFVERVEPNFYGEIELLAFCLMPNHFHLMLKQINVDSMQRFMKCLATRYSIYFNKRHKRVGSLFQGVYKAALIESDDYLLHLSRYIHLNPVKDATLRKLSEYDWSSYANYLGLRNYKWLAPQFILDIFEQNSGPGLDKFKSYNSFIEEYQNDSREMLGRLSID